MAAPGTPNATEMPSFCSTWTAASAAVIFAMVFSLCVCANTVVDVLYAIGDLLA
jgi:hypothetical protein